ncbi:inositol monophosphatase family protein [Aureibacillus halotolerans]|uniref:inositol-phosphate phosphatase n=1 Tax=Aureibacillus halotolerans TaxID=1508390 RepID=A0A4R6U6X4_9BACI|nr:inositol monophosphatase family protein [Aureibacillus halotolerans]TDQ42270.1 myo-inositol-1(or 4)-monophosphatase [Aureibacillus halotolerans]
MDTKVWQERMAQATLWVREAGARIRKSMENPLHVETKSNANDLVTNMDKETEQFFVSRIQSHYPEHYILGEEGFGDQLETIEGTVWIIDPIDGTMNFVHQKRHFTISLGVYHDGVGMFGLVYDVMADDLYAAFNGEGATLNNAPLMGVNDADLHTAIVGLNANWLTTNEHMPADALHFLVQKARGVRSYGSAALEIVYVAAGFLDAYATMRLSPWDYAGGLIIAKEAGAVGTTLQGEPLNLLHKQSVLIATPKVHKEIVERLHGASS